MKSAAFAITITLALISVGYALSIERERGRFMDITSSGVGDSSESITMNCYDDGTSLVAC